MKNKTLISALVSVCLVAGSGASFAQNHDDHRDDRDNHAQAEHKDDHGDRRNDRADYRPVENNARHDGPRGAGPRHDMVRGQRIAPEYRGNQYVVDDWRGHHLSAPPRGQHWVQTGGDYVLVAVATGIIAQVLLGN
jgi:Ni/Co efflux regulator RcnB